MRHALPSFFLLAALPTAHASGRAPGSGFHEMSEAESARVLREIHARHPGFAARVLALSGRFLGAPYRFDPLGEGPESEFDRDPTFDLTRVDCLTLVEQVLAMAHTPDLALAKRLLQRIRYDGGVIDFRRRHHFAMSQWIPANQRLGVLRDVTADVGGTAVRLARKRIDESTWRGRKWRRWLQRLGPRAPRGEFTLPIIPIDAAIGLSERFPEGSLVSVVRVDRRGDPTRVSHQGIVVVKNGRRYLRHASSGPRFRRVIDYSLRGYFRFSRRYFRERWPVLGVNVQRLEESRALSSPAP
jgi:D-alanyl-D-alanine carboxypeptidase/D-alanyl-D-alanine-endopeptidase (penicillin-binding protein 4)